MTIPIPPIPVEYNTEHLAYDQQLDAAVRELQSLINGIAPPSGFIATINDTLVPDVAGNVNITAADLDAMSSGYVPALTDLPVTVPDFVYKSAGGTGVWPTAYAADGTADYTGGLDDQGIRPHSLAKPVVWLGYPPYPPTVSSGNGGMLRGLDQTATPEA